MNMKLNQNKQKPQTKIDLSSLLIADFTYVAQTAFQANEERAKATTFYLLSVVSVLATVWATNSPYVDHAKTALAFSVIFGLLSIFGIITLLQLARLRASWFDSVQAMNAIKMYALQSQKTLVENPFPWTQANLPKKFKAKSIAAFLALQVLVMSSVTCGACIFHFGQYININSSLVVPAFLGAIVWASISLLLYFWVLNEIWIA
ncbi:MAG: hypothetical protein R2867_29745 [Caldilineaceae bacterium]